MVGNDHIHSSLTSLTRRILRGVRSHRPDTSKSRHFLFYFLESGPDTGRGGSAVGYAHRVKATALAWSVGAFPLWLGLHVCGRLTLDEAMILERHSGWDNV